MKKGQASIEFLSMYGWAITVIIVLVGTIAYFGVFDKSTFLKPYCSVTRELYCEEYGITQNTVTLVIRNNFEKDINISRLSLLEEESGTTISCALNAGAGEILTVGKKAQLCCDFGSNVLAKGEKKKISLSLNYSRAVDGANIYSATGSVLASAGQASSCP
jgi:hypothetical protein